MPDNARPRKLFTLEEANAMLPLVRAIVADLASLSREVIERRERLLALRTNRQGASRDLYGEELAEIEQQFERDTDVLAGYVEELTELGVEPKNAPEGLVDFPCLMDGRVVYLCWKLGEPEIGFWHELEAGFAGRQPLDRSQSVAPASSGSGDS